MKRRDFIQTGFFATASVVLLPQMQNPNPQNHFIAIGETGGQTLEVLYKNGLRGRYTWIKRKDSNNCKVPDLNQIEIEHPYSSDYFVRDRITKMPVAYEHDVPDWNSICRKAQQNILLTQPTCYLGMFLSPRLASFLNENDYPFHTIAVRPFRFYSRREKDATATALQELGAFSGKLTVVISDSIRCQGNLNLAVAFERLYMKIYKETKCILNRFT